jgi:hypothetical protein
MTNSRTDYFLLWAAVGWVVLGLLTLGIGVTWFFGGAAQHFPLWLCADHYVAAELEVTHFRPPTGRWGTGRTTIPSIKGVIHPGGERIVTSSRRLALGRFVDPNDRTGRHMPLREEVEGRRLAVRYWPGHADVERWWHPPTAVTPETIPEAGGLVVYNVLLGVAFVAFGVSGIRHGFRMIKRLVP